MKIAIIPARGGSQGIHKKNLCNLGGKPLLWWTLNAALESKKIDKVFVTTDDQEIADYTSSMGVEVILRPENISGSTATSESAIVHALDKIESSFDKKIDLVIFLQATSPLRLKDDIDNAVDEFFSLKADSLFSSSIADDLTLWQKNHNNQFQSINYDYKNRTIRQEAPVQYIENGSIYIFTPNIIRMHNNRLAGKIDTYVMKSWQVHEIDVEDDLELIEYYLDKITI